MLRHVQRVGLLASSHILKSATTTTTSSVVPSLTRHGVAPAPDPSCLKEDGPRAHEQRGPRLIHHCIRSHFDEFVEHPPMPSSLTSILFHEAPTGKPVGGN